MNDILDGQIKRVGVVLDLATIFGSSIRQHTQQADLVLGEEGNDAVVQQISRGDRGRLSIKFAERHAGVCVDESSLVDAPHALHCSNVMWSSS